MARTKGSEARTDWFSLRENTIRDAIRARNVAQLAFNRAQKPGVPMPQEVVEALRKARKAVKREVAQAKRDWMSDVVLKLSHS